MVCGVFGVCSSLWSIGLYRRRRFADQWHLLLVYRILNFESTLSSAASFFILKSTMTQSMQQYQITWIHDSCRNCEMDCLCVKRFDGCIEKDGFEDFWRSFDGKIAPGIEHAQCALGDVVSIWNVCCPHRRTYD